ncbi:GNAT family N-acetyltransferase [Paenibacillus sp. Y412MC10]|uniref:GNAT family N-acetyltransferase n=1 Tax=Geobacillus sp. (strain Y412MC10) TaxID=481743 RepID=UPI0011A9E8CE|nr:GNAT family N-acetyltransferase [Paenibacillus sp. Y412MC10]
MITIREITKADLNDLCRLYEELIDQPTNYEKMEEIYEVMQASGNYHILGAFKDGVLAGSVMGIVCQDLVGECRPFMVIENVVVSDRFRRLGIGKQLMINIEAIARERDCYYVIFVSGGQRKEAHAFYEKLGFKDEKVEGYRKHLS